MKKLLTVSLLAMAVSFAATGAAFSAQASKYGVVEVQKVLNKSESVKALKAERTKQKETIANFIKDSNAKVAAEKDAKKKEELKKKLNNELKYMAKTYDTKYQDGLKKINDSINADIAKLAKEKNLELIMTSDSVLYGGQNITNDLIKIVK